jgi:hypothetical protein
LGRSRRPSDHWLASIWTTLLVPIFAFILLANGEIASTAGKFFADHGTPYGFRWQEVRNADLLMRFILGACLLAVALAACNHGHVTGSQPSATAPRDWAARHDYISGAPALQRRDTPGGPTAALAPTTPETSSPRPAGDRGSQTQTTR